MTESGTRLRNNNEQIVRLMAILQKERNDMNYLIERQKEEKNKIQNEIEKLTFKLSLLTKSLNQRMKAIVNYDKTIKEIEEHYAHLVEQSYKLLSCLTKEVRELEEIMDKKTETDSKAVPEPEPPELEVPEPEPQPEPEPELEVPEEEKAPPLAPQPKQLIQNLSPSDELSVLHEEINKKRLEQEKESRARRFSIEENHTFKKDINERRKSRDLGTEYKDINAAKIEAELDADFRKRSIQVDDSPPISVKSLTEDKIGFSEENTQKEPTKSPSVTSFEISTELDDDDRKKPGLISPPDHSDNKMMPLPAIKPLGKRPYDDDWELQSFREAYEKQHSGASPPDTRRSSRSSKQSKQYSDRQ